MPATLYVGCNSTVEKLNGAIDDLVILDHNMIAAANDECLEMRAVYESNAPVFAETAKYAFRATPKGLVWGDDEGLWVRDTAGVPVFGIYANEAGGKSWGGFTLDVGDLVIGNNAAGSAAIRWDQSAGTFSFYGNGAGTAQVRIGTDGVLYTGTAGSTRVQMSSAGLAGYDSSNARQWYGDTGDGKLYGAEGVAWLDRTGLNIIAPASASIGPANWVSWPTLGNLSTMSAYIGAGFTGTSGNPNGELFINARTGAGTSLIHLNATEVNSGGLFKAAGSLMAGGDSGAAGGYVVFTNATQGVAAGTGTIKCNGASARNSTGWLKIWVGATARYIPYFDTVTG